MAGTKIFVLQLKDVIKTIVFAVFGLVLIVLLVYMLVPKHPTANAAAPNAGALYVPGTYTAEIILNDEPVDVNVTVSGDSILTVSLGSLDETITTFYPLLQPAMDDLSQEIVQYQTTRLTPSSDYSVTGELLLQAVQSALNQASIDAQYQTADSENVPAA
jgi:uncharacterized protein with FMN-binding domain